ncbi:unnamed protein product, partial [Heterotrigona itama]
TTGPTVRLEVPGQNSTEKADNLAGCLRQVFSNNGDVKVSRPRKMAEIRISGLDGSVTPAEVVSAVTKAGKCDAEDVKTGEIRHRTPMSMGSNGPRRALRHWTSGRCSASAVWRWAIRHSAAHSRRTETDDATDVTHQAISREIAPPGLNAFYTRTWADKRTIAWAVKLADHRRKRKPPSSNGKKQQGPETVQ